MRILVVFLWVGLVTCYPHGQTASDAESYFRWQWMEIFLQYERDPGFRLAAQQIEKPHQAIQSISTWNCVPFASTREPQTIHELTPPDIKIIAAMGDSITAGNGIQDGTIFETAVEDRGKSWSIGIQDTVREIVTIANILTEYNTNLKGGSSGIGPVFLPNSRLNVAEPGSKSHHMLEQADRLIERLIDNLDPAAYENEWKMVTMFIGSNDICDHCNNLDYGWEEYVARVKVGLDRLHQTVPRMFVNLVPTLDQTPLRHMSRGFMCDYAQEQFCGCVVRRETSDQTRPLQLEYYNGLKDLIETGIYDTRDDFTVVLQPMLVNQGFPRDDDGNYDDSWLGGDCFHPNAKSHAFMAMSLWNTMFELEGRKSLSQFGRTDIYCPVQGETFKTRINSVFASANEAVDDGKQPELQGLNEIARHPGHPSPAQTRQQQQDSDIQVDARRMNEIPRHPGHPSPAETRQQHQDSDTQVDAMRMNEIPRHPGHPSPAETRKTR